MHYNVTALWKDGAIHKMLKNYLKGGIIDMQNYDYFLISLLNCTKDVKRVVKKY